MNTEDLSLIISFVAVSLAAVALGWNIYRDVILKAKVKVSFKIVEIYHETLPQIPQYINISVTNFGPGRIKIMNIQAMNAPWRKRLLQTKQYGVIISDNANPLSGKLPSWIDEGDKLDLLLPYEKDSFLQEGHTHVGVYDYYGRSHWATKEDVLEVQQQWKKDFQKPEV